MRILVLAKRQYTGKDLLDDRFGRLRELPLELSKLGHDVIGLCWSYRRRKDGIFPDDDPDSGACVRWHSRNLGKSVFPGLIKHFRYAGALTRELRPDLIWACSDSFHAILGARLGQSTHTRCVVDLYDNFESFGASRIPGVLQLLKKALRSADGVTCVSEPLAKHIFQNYRRSGPTLVLENGVRPDLFHTRERTACRKQLGLPEGAKIIGTAGAISRSRGIDALFGAFAMLAGDHPDLHLVIAGPRDRRTRIPTGLRVHDLGVLPFENVSTLLNALDVAAVCNRDSTFGRYNFPQKAYEIIGCGVPLVAAAAGAMKDLLVKYPNCLFKPDDPASCAEAIRFQLKNPSKIDLVVPTWSGLAKQLETFFLGLVKADA
jgi:teichuronic acid biosynthesis glycosyltransferase TuaC